jgi:Alw26I/Eco31I/Esp3I family type II restriction m6 adenine DNA methyltransferase
MHEPVIEAERSGFGAIRWRVRDRPQRRKRRGLFYTPWPVAECLASTVLDNLPRGFDLRDASILDPFIGVGVLPAALIEALVARQGCNRDALLGRLCGAEIDERALEVCAEALEVPQEKLRHIDSLSSPLEQWTRRFDLIVTNPPWEKVRVNDREFFSAYDPAFSRLNRRIRDPRRDELLEQEDVRAAYTAYVERVAQLKIAARTHYQTTGSGGDLDLYKMSVERVISLLRPGGIAGLIIPHGILGDWGARKLRIWILENHRILDIRRMETGPELFPEIHANLGVVMLIVQRASSDSAPERSGGPKIRISSAARTLKELATAESVSVPARLIQKATSSAMIPLVERSEDVALIEHCLEFPALLDWPEPAFRPRREIDMTLDRRHFGAVGTGVPLLEGKHLAPYDLEAGAHRFEVPTQVAPFSDTMRIAWRAVADRAMKRRLIAARVPLGVGLGNSLIFSTFETSEELLWMLAWMNSRIADAQLRLWCANNNINIFHIRACRVPCLERCGQANEIIRLAAQLDEETVPEPALVDRLDALWREIYRIPERIWVPSVLDRTTAVTAWRRP